MKKFLSIILTLSMLLGMVPAISIFAAEETTTWTKVEWADIEETDTFAITVTVGGGTYVLPVVEAGNADGSKAIPEITGTVDGNTLTVISEYSFGWTRSATEGGYHIKSGDYYLYVAASNNGIRIYKKNPDITFVWNLLDCGLLGAYHEASGSTVASYRTLCVDSTLAAPQWGAYPTTGNVADGTANSKVRDNVMGFWKLNTGDEGGDSGDGGDTGEDGGDNTPAESTYWKKTDWANIQSTDTFAITATVGESTYVLPVVQSGNADGSKAIPEITGSVEGNTLTISNTEYTFGWKRSDAGDGHYYIQSADSNYYLYVGNSDNGIRIYSRTENQINNTFVWDILPCGYLGATDGTFYRTLGISNEGQWITGKTGSSKNGDEGVLDAAVNTHFTDNTIEFWKLSTNHPCVDDSNDHKCDVDGCGVKLTEHDYDADGECTICGAQCQHDYEDKSYQANCTEAARVVHTCKVCGFAYADTNGEPNGHKYTNTPAGNGQHTVGCENCDYSDTEDCTEGADHKCAKCGQQLAQPVAEVDGVKYESLAEAVKNAAPGAEIKLLASTSGSGIVIDKNLTIDFGGFTYTVVGEKANGLVGSSGTETLGFQILKGNNVTLKNGTLKAGTDACKMLIQNYANLTLDGFTADGTGSTNMQYVLSNNSGKVSIKDSAIKAPEGAFAFDVCYYQGYSAPEVTVSGNSVVTGIVEVTGGTLTVEGGTFTSAGDIFYVTSGNVTINGGNFTAVDNVVYLRGGDVVINDGELKSTGGIYAAIQGNGYYGGNVTVKGGTITSAEVGIYWPQNGALTITGGTITGVTAVYAKSGTITIEGGELVATGAKVDYDYNGNGNNPTGDALVIDSCGGEYETPTVRVIDGTFKSAHASAVASYAGNGASVVSGFVSGGTFNTAVSEELCAEGIIPSYNEETGEYGVKVGSYVAQNATTGVKYESLAEAVKNAASGAEIKLLVTTEGSGIVIDKDLTIDFGDNIYTFTSPAVGSNGTQTLGFQILENNTVILKNGTLNVTEPAKEDFAMLIQNYADLTLNGMVLDGTNLDRYTIKEYNYSYVLSNNSGNVNIVDTIIIANNGGDAYAFDACKYSSYAAPTVTVSGNSVIGGIIEVTGGALALNGGNFEGAELVYTSGSVTKGNVEIDAPEDYEWVDGVLTEIKYAAQINGTKFDSFANALAAAQAGDTIVLMSDIDYGTAAIIAMQAITIDLNGHTLTAGGLGFFCDGGSIVDNGETKGLLKLPAADCLVMTNAAAESMLPVWNEEGTGYLFVKVNHQYQYEAVDGDSFLVVLRPDVSGHGVQNSIFADGAADNGLSLYVNVYCMKGDEEKQVVTFRMTDALISSIYSNGNAIQLTMNGASTSYDSYKIEIVLTSNRGATASSGIIATFTPGAN